MSWRLQLALAVLVLTCQWEEIWRPCVVAMAERRKNKAGDYRGMSEGSQKSARANARRVGAKKGETPRALQHAVFASDATIEALTPPERRQEIDTRWKAVREQRGHSESVEFESLYKSAQRLETRLEEIGSGDLPLGAAQERLACEVQLVKVLDRLLMTPESQIRNGVPERRAAAERAARAEQRNPNKAMSTADRVDVIRALIKAAMVPGAMLIPLADEPLDPVFQGVVRRLISEGRIDGAFLASVPDVYGDGR